MATVTAVRAITFTDLKNYNNFQHARTSWHSSSASYIYGKVLSKTAYRMRSWQPPNG